MEPNQDLYLLLDSRGTGIARGRVVGRPAGNLWQIEVQDGEVDKVLEHKKLKLLSILDAGPSYEGVIVRSRNDMIQLEVTKLYRDTTDKRKNLRVAVAFESFIYPLTGGWSGRRSIQSKDLSCGGIAFFTDSSLRVGEQIEVVVPVTVQPMVVRCEILRTRPGERPDSILYAGKFVELCNDEETLLREAVFNLQLRGRLR